MNELLVVGTGHRPPRLGLGYDAESNRLLTEFARQHLNRMSKVHSEFVITEVISGMAQGWDMALAHAAILLGIDLVCALPFVGMGNNWPADAQRRRDAILSKAKLVHVLYRCGYKTAGNRSYFERDRWMVDRAGRAGGLLLALWDGTEQGGTWETVKYARTRDVPVGNCWRAWTEYVAGVSSSVKPSEESTHESRTRSLGEAPR